MKDRPFHIFFSTKLMYEVKTEQYTGPLQKLLELVEGKKLEITSVNLSAVTADFIDYVKSLEGKMSHGSLADFIVIASRLMLIKSKALLPGLELTREEEGQIKDLESRLLLYRQFKAAGELLKKNFDLNGVAYSRQLLEDAPRFFYPSKDISIDSMHAAIAKILQSIEMLVPKDERIVSRTIVSIEEKMAELLERTQKSRETSFQNLAAGKSRGEIVVLFLAILHLLKNRHVGISQINQFDDILITKGGGLN